MSGRDRSASVMKERLAYEAARIMVEQGLSDFESARRKAAERTGDLDRRHWPSNEAIRDAVLARQRLFLGSAHARVARSLRREAVQAMRMLEDFRPRLIGSVLTGVGDRHSVVELFLFADRPEDVLFLLTEKRIPWREAERVLRYPGGRNDARPVFRFMAGETPFELIVLPPRDRRHPPLDPITEKPWLGADLAEVERLLDEAAPD